MIGGDDHVAWEDLEAAAKQMFNVWLGGGELTWAKEAWEHLRCSGLTNGGTALMDTATKLRLVTLARVYREFCMLAWDEGGELPLRYLAEHLDIDQTALGVLAAAGGIDPGFGGTEGDLLEAAVEAVTRSQRREVFSCLKAAYGSDYDLYIRLLRTQTTEEGDDAGALEPTPNTCAAYDYVRGGFLRG